MCTTCKGSITSNCSLGSEFKVTWSSDDDCAYCGEGVSCLLDPMMIACGCKSRVVHASCLHKWLRMRPDSSLSKFQCEVCKTPYLGGGCLLGLWILLAIPSVSVFTCLNTFITCLFA